MPASPDCYRYMVVARTGPGSIIRHTTEFASACRAAAELEGRYGFDAVTILDMDAGAVVDRNRGRDGAVFELSR